MSDQTQMVRLTAMSGMSRRYRSPEIAPTRSATAGITTASQVVWISDGARGFWRLYREYFAHCAVGLDFYHAAQHLWQLLYQDGNPAHTQQQWFARMRHQLRHGFGKRIIKELDWLSKSKNTSDVTKPILSQVRDYLTIHLDHIRIAPLSRWAYRLEVAWLRVPVNG